MTDTGRIRVLPPEVAERIAAGEVVDRPVSVIRELVDNALDAGASSVAIDIEAGGQALIRVSDDGSGIRSDEVELAFARHAASKIRDVDDLHRLCTLGFRGEALPSIAAVAEITLVSRQADASSGALVTFRGGSCVRREKAARQPATTATIRQLFFNVPARLKLLGPARSEAPQVVQLVRQFALASPEVRFSLNVDGHLSFASHGGGPTREATAAILGPTVAAALRPLVVSNQAIQEIRLAGFVTARTVTRADRRQLMLVINGRRTATPGLLEALERAYRPFLPRGRHPIGLIQLELPPDEVDPNVHPAKSEVRLLREADVANLLTTAIRETFGQLPDRPGELDDFALAPSQFKLPRPRHHIFAAAGPVWGELPVGAALRGAQALTQVLDTLVLVESPGGLYAVDQHRAHERIIYERLRGRAADTRADASQALLEPLVLELTPRQTRQLEGRLDALHGLGLECQRFGSHDFLVRAVPADLLPGEEWAGMVQEVLEAAAAPDERWQGRLMANLACRTAIRRQRPLSAAEMRRLIAELGETVNPAACPHGSPVVLHFSGDFLRRQFRW